LWGQSPRAKTPHAGRLTTRTGREKARTNTSFGSSANATDYYTLLDLESIATKLHGAEFARWMLAQKEPLEMLFRLADEGGVVLLPGKGFGARHPSARASLANLNEYDYVKIGSVIRSLADEYFSEFARLHAAAAE
jgi:aspartate 4-decarboxylase